MKNEAAIPETWQHSAPGESLAGLSRVLHALLGLDIAVYDEGFLQQSIAKHLLATGLTSITDYAGYVAEHPGEAAAFQLSLRINHSTFFRNPLTYALLEQQILPKLAAAKQLAGLHEIRIWSAGCAAGQEVWSVAMLLDELTGKADMPLDYRIFGTDLSAADLTLAQTGVYSEKAMRNVRLRHLRECCSKQGESYAIAPRLLARADFSAHDLLDEDFSSPEAGIYGDFDLILCCNLLFYYRPTIQQQILNKLCRALAPGGYLLTGKTERDNVTKHPGLHTVTTTPAIFQKSPP
jgi:chemotaxis protein methyltransferase CheR